MSGAEAPRAPIALALAVTVAALVVDQASKLWILKGTDLADGGAIGLLPVLDLVLVWNRGISYGLFQQDDPVGRWGLVGFTVLAAVVLSVWMLRTNRRLVAASLALIVGGAIGNLIDRVAYGAVVDFVYFHVGSFSWYVFNLADVWIVAGVAGLLYDSFRPGHTDASKVN
ncbi:signal peptidase II [Oharaeibacter diazotrophicus]|uniref:Lipoprotein signal peptidase n=1 Tax=Oharaeibacter diazotrophicus TaxID=1920512 RepID=A0A4V3CVR3_9HYPH|nr:signal peptidase II [Oharaeibacter diazotrophicus]TDP83458.1 signal peptidase II [Oharaeibacter diazotrophicus]BBE72291.1 lipoprotein signal peptidase [Pleomorphomonas sp. SM30]GLS79061.1 lipoprotein signal peptidase [Oharaeibacter diazotrophicus]